MAAYFVDNDAILKLSAYNLFWDAMKALGAKDDDIRVLPTASSFFSANRLKEQYSAQTLQQATRIAQQRTKAMSHNSAAYATLLSVDGIDPGEATLVAAALSETDFYLVTADKRFLKAISSSGLSPILNHLNNRIICLEQLIIQVIKYEPDFDKVARRIGQAVECEVSIATAFREGKQSDKTEVLQLLDHDVKILRSQTGNLLTL